MDRKRSPALGTHLTTTVLWHSLAYGEQAAGLTHADLNLAIGHPDLNFDDYDAALSALRGDDMDVACYFLYEEERLRFKQEPNLIRIIDQRIESTPKRALIRVSRTVSPRRKSAMVASSRWSSLNRRRTYRIHLIRRSSR